MNLNYIKKIIPLLAFSGLYLTGTTLAYFSDYETVVNQVSPGNNNTEVKEEFPDPEPKPLDENPEFSKTVWVENLSDGKPGQQVSCYVRVSLSYSNYDIGNAVSLLGLNTKDWIYDAQDEYYYYRHILPAGRKTTPLFTGFRVDSSKLDKDLKGDISEFSINVYEESVQAEGFSDYRTAWNYYLKPVQKT